MMEPNATQMVFQAVSTNFITVTNFVTVTLTNATSDTSLNPIELLGKVNSFYETSWQHLMFFVSTIVTIAVAVFGIAIPLIQRAVLRRDKKDINREIESLIKNGEGSLNMELTAHKKELGDLILKYKHDISELRDEIEKKNFGAQGHIFQVQGQRFYELKKYADAIRNFLVAVTFAAKSDQEELILPMLKTIADLLPLIKKVDIEGNPLLKKNLDSAIKVIGEKNSTDEFTDALVKLQTAFQEASNR